MTTRTDLSNCKSTRAKARRGPRCSRHRRGCNRADWRKTRSTLALTLQSCDIPTRQFRMNCARSGLRSRGRLLSCDKDAGQKPRGQAGMPGPHLLLSGHGTFTRLRADWSMIPRGFPPRRPRIRENVNEAIRAREVRAVFPDGTVEVMPTPQAVRKAQDMGLDLILIAPTAEPPVAKAMDYGQWQYENKKKQHEQKRKQHIIQVKELKFRPN